MVRTIHSSRAYRLKLKLSHHSSFLLVQTEHALANYFCTVSFRSVLIWVISSVKLILSLNVDYRYRLFLFDTAPAVAPPNLRALTINSTAIEVQWEPVPEDERNGKITSYEILVVPEQFQATFFVNDSVLTTFTIVISGLEEFVNYTFSIRAYTSEGPGPFSSNTTNRTFTAG